MAHVGLGDLDSVERVQIRWPDGAVSSIENLDTRAQVQVVRD